MVYTNSSNVFYLLFQATEYISSCSQLPIWWKDPTVPWVVSMRIPVDARVPLQPTTTHLSSTSYDRILPRLPLWIRPHPTCRRSSRKPEQPLPSIRHPSHLRRISLPSWDWCQGFRINPAVERSHSVAVLKIILQGSPMRTLSQIYLIKTGLAEVKG